MAIIEEYFFIEFIQVNDKCQFIVNIHVDQILVHVLKNTYPEKHFELIYQLHRPDEKDVTGIVLSSVKTPCKQAHDELPHVKTKWTEMKPWYWVLLLVFSAFTGLSAISVAINLFQLQ